MLLDRELNDLLNKEIAVVMSDGQCYRGILQKFDDTVMVLSDVFETSNREVEWIEQDPENPHGPKVGYMSWRRVTLPKVILRIPMTLRIWPWSPKRVEEGKTAMKDPKTAEKKIKKKK